MKDEVAKPVQITAWFAIVLVTVGAFFGTYYYHFSGPIKALVWIVWLVAILGFGYFTSQGRSAWAFSKEAKAELDKVVWPTRPETVQTTSIVMVMVAVTGFALWGVDSIVIWVISKLTQLG
ncbi:preprotein translocase subunit SecE [Legionella geestiana]|uniref:Protein translocase subunit SecE n=1 Tax=Legionella geestiana TaxID=45065 RepID=A0A0W0TWP5_9GAMM|nr:preprotein translocase subunit SecE [Legionella geestiana]KTD00069.1 preprotein translocase subunit SecE [Legionella geestiana]QBS12590.1 preprotein translocase subunit SecE [Legionella geestiana]QDQ39694.1 preprotein translocase subunit SecE [Legionella geestiana]STX54956.1 preprotein translocase subunit SecE [Legionella geestiana]